MDLYLNQNLWNRGIDISQTANFLLPKRIIVFSNVHYPEEKKFVTLENDILVFMNLAVTKEYYKNDYVAEKIHFHRENNVKHFGKESENMKNYYVYGKNGIPEDEMKEILNGYDFNYKGSKSAKKEPTTGYIVVKWLKKKYPDYKIILVNFGYDVIFSTERHPQHNWKFENYALKEFEHVYIEDNPKKILFIPSPWLGDNVYTSAVIENIVATKKFAVNVKSKNVLWKNCTLLDRSVNKHNADYVIHACYTKNWKNNCLHIVHSTCTYISREVKTPIPIVTKHPHIYFDLSNKRLIQEPYIIINTGWQDTAPVKKWSREYWMKLISMFNDHKFVQIGQSKNHAVPIDGTINMIDKTSTEDLCRLVRDAECVISPPSGVIHISAAYDVPFISIAGGREPASLVSYPCGTSISMVGKMECCKKEGCKTNYFNRKEKTCLHCENNSMENTPTAQCMLMITPEMVADEIRKLLNINSTSTWRITK